MSLMALALPSQIGPLLFCLIAFLGDSLVSRIEDGKSDVMIFLFKFGCTGIGGIIFNPEGLSCEDF